MHHILMILAALCCFIALIIFFQTMSNAFKKNFLWGVVYILFPIGSYFYYKKFIAEEKSSAIWLTVCLVVAVLSVIITKLIL